MIWRTTSARIATWFGFILMCLGMFMAILDIQVVATSLPAIQHSLRISPDAMSWIQTAYLIAEITAIPLTGWLTRVLTLRWLFVIAIFIFTVTSIGCAFSTNFTSLVSFRILQGFAGGTLIPAVFSGIFLLFPPRAHPIAGTIAGIVAVLAPTVGPVVGGWITHHYSWPWLFLINVVPGVIAVVATPFLLPRGRPRLNQLKHFDAMALALMAVALASLEIGLKQAPHNGWFSAVCFGLFALCAAATAAFAVRTLKAVQPLVELRTLKVSSFSVGCGLSFCLGVGLFGAVYLMPVFLAYVRQQDPLQIGSIMLVTGAAQLVAAPIAGALESRVNPRWLSAFGFGLFAIGLGMSAFESRTADFDEMFWPQVLRGFAAMFCLLPPTRLALETLPHKQVPDASGLFNMMRNLGGAVGIALIDTVLYGRTSGHAEAIRQRLIAGDITTAKAIGLDRISPDLAAAASMIEQAAFATSVNEAWALLAAVALLGLLIIPLARSQRPAAEG
ncbi:MAG: DHA2 family efflux MFS transporter permease subunit [Bradyrhizobium sp.]|uniref:DHA2 family efflux MFS transporter permease subunit n=1 Tax=Bradyrhizobium sp. TaxID=376 RepID=UPI002730CF47|nr:DHA2 family efflux MFS transporter permease subunit [Bradyrhizobium sp.]MDP1866525.1 DHA2 family efflux MFS transporter permease subunit [Bradyrhizobium sp.]